MSRVVVDEKCIVETAWQELAKKLRGMLMMMLKRERDKIKRGERRGGEEKAGGGREVARDRYISFFGDGLGP